MRRSFAVAAVTLAPTLMLASPAHAGPPVTDDPSGEIITISTNKCIITRTTI